MKRVNPGKVFQLIGGIFLTLGLLSAGTMAVLGFKMGFTEQNLGFILPLSIIGFVFVILGATFLGVGTAIGGKNRKKLMETGERIDAEIVDIERDQMISVNGRCPWRVVCGYSEAGVNYICRSEMLANRPEVISKHVTIWRDPANKKKYYVDLEGAVAETVEL